MAIGRKFALHRDRTNIDAKNIVSSTAPTAMNIHALAFLHRATPFPPCRSPAAPSGLRSDSADKPFMLATRFQNRTSAQSSAIKRTTIIAHDRNSPTRGGKDHIEG